MKERGKSKEKKIPPITRRIARGFDLLLIYLFVFFPPNKYVCMWKRIWWELGNWNMYAQAQTSQMNPIDQKCYSKHNLEMKLSFHSNFHTRSDLRISIYPLFDWLSRPYSGKVGKKLYGNFPDFPFLSPSF